LFSDLLYNILQRTYSLQEAETYKSKVIRKSATNCTTNPHHHENMMFL